MDKATLFQEISHALVEFEVEKVAEHAEETLQQNIPAYGDPVGAIGIIEPKVYREYSGPSSWRIIKGIREGGGKVLLHLCGKTSTALEKIEMARSYPIEADEASTYGQALLGQLDKSTEPIVIGHRCIKGSLNRMSQPILWGIELI